MKKILTLFALGAVGIFISADAKVVSPEAAWQRVNPTMLTVMSEGSSVMPELVMSKTENGVPTVYVFSHGKDSGYYLVSADDNAVALLGYSDHGNFDLNNIPDGLAYWIDEYSRQISMATATGGKVMAAPVDPSLTSIAPIVKTKWNQNAPYNDLCPKQNGKATYSGCVATALAQILNVYKFPEKGIGRRSYSWNGQTLSMNFSTTTFDWANMLDTYGSSATDEQKKAVATLMYGLGVASEMNYSTSGSGTNAVVAGRGLIQNFNYDKSLKYLRRDYYPLVDWVKIIHSELSSGRPLYYDGQSSSGGHAFVFDGYNAQDGFFHVNWGWGGMSDGYFQVTTLDPGSQGIGGGVGGYSSGQGILINLKPAVSGTLYQPNMYLSTGLCTASNQYARTATVRILKNEQSKGCYSYAFVDINYEFGLKLVSSTGAVSYVWSTRGSVSLQPYTGYNYFEFKGSDFPTSGTYTVTMVCKGNNIISDALAPIGETRALKLECSANALTFSPIENKADLKAKDIELKTPLYSSKTAVFTANITNSGDEYYGAIKLGFVKSSYTSENDLLCTINGAPIDIIKGETLEAGFRGTLSNISVGDYKIGIFTGDNKLISDLKDVKVETAPSGSAVGKIINVQFPEKAGGEGTTSNPALVYTTPFTVKAAVECTRGYFEDGVGLYLFTMAGGTSIFGMSGDHLPVAAGSSTPIEFSSVVDLNIGQSYFFMFLNTTTGQWFDAYQRFYITFVGETAGIDDISVDSGIKATITPNPAEDVATLTTGVAIDKVEIYSLAGTTVYSANFGGVENSVDLYIANLAKGHYIVKVITADGAMETIRLMKK